MTTEEKRFALRRTYIKDASFENPLAPEIFKERTEPGMEVALRVEVKPLEADRHEVTLTCTVNASVEGRTLYLCEVKQAGVFVAHGFAEAELTELLNIAAPTVLFPYARAEITHLTVMGGFAPLMLAPVDFGLMYARSRQAPAGQA